MKKLLATMLIALSLCSCSTESNAYCGYSRCYYRPRYVVVRHYRTHHWIHTCRVRYYRHYRRY